MIKYFLSLLLTLIFNVVFAQFPSDRNSLSKNNLYIYWGWNWSGYTDSDIRFKGDAYDLLLA